jgi:hypothetical protein
MWNPWLWTMQSIRNVPIVTLTALDVVQMLEAFMGKTTAMARSTLISARKRPDVMAPTFVEYQI